MDQLEGSSRTPPAQREQQFLRLRDRVEARAARKFSDVELEGKPISAAIRFICFVVADFTETLKKVIRSSIANNPTADGQGFFGYSREHNATVEVIPYDKVLHDAKVRNEAFFARLG